MTSKLWREGDRSVSTSVDDERNISSTGNEEVIIYSKCSTTEDSDYEKREETIGHEKRKWWNIKYVSVYIFCSATEDYVEHLYSESHRKWEKIYPEII